MQSGRSHLKKKNFTLVKNNRETGSASLFPNIQIRIIEMQSKQKQKNIPRHLRRKERDKPNRNKLYEREQKRELAKSCLEKKTYTYSNKIEARKYSSRRRHLPLAVYAAVK